MAVVHLLRVVTFLACHLAHSVGGYCDCYPSYYTCLNVTELGFDSFPLFGQLVDQFQVRT